jgi:5'-nucleotidase
MNRRGFIKNSALASAALAFVGSPLNLFAGEGYVKLTILHTNDTHSRIDPFPEGTKYAGMGGAAKRSAIINQIREEEKNVILLDAGDIFQGTPYFNMYGGELDYKLMSQMRYDATTLGNHDFDAGIDGLIKQMPFASFDFVNTNYGFNDTPLLNKIQKYKIIQKENIKIGITGVGIELQGLVPKSLYGNVQYYNPIDMANQTASFLKNEENCDLIICLSHLGYEYNSKKVSDVVLAQNSENIDIIIGGHTHTFMDKPMVINNLKNRPVVINQAGWAGILLGRLEVVMKAERKKNANKAAPVIFSKKTIVK